MLELSIRTQNRTDFIDVTAHIKEAVSKSKIKNGLCCVFVPHTTAGITINENADPDVVTDIISHLNKSVPWNSGYHHREGNSAAHIKASLTGFSQNILISNGKLVLGTWQGIYFTEFDGPRTRKVLIEIIEKK
jgi:secondary thiamine-phosphate synthase enzyme